MRIPRRALLFFVQLSLSLLFPAAWVFAQAPVVSITPATLSLPTVTATSGRNYSGQGQVILSNTGTATLNISSVSVSGADYTVESFCGSTVVAGSSCQIDVMITAATPGLKTGVLTINDDAADSPQTVPLTGYGTWLRASAYGVFFPVQLVNTSSSAQSITLTNTGSQPIPLSPFSITGDFTQTNTCGSALAGGASCNIAVTFSPAGDGNRTGSLSFVDNSPDGGGTILMSLSGSATWLTTSPSSLTFSFQAVGTSSAPQPVVIQNTATISVGLSISLNSKPPFGSTDFSETDNCSTALAAGASCTVNVVYTPSAPGGSFDALIVTTDGVTQMVTLSGPATWYKVSPASLSFSPQLIGTTTAPQTINLTNSSNASQNVSLSFSGTSFAQSNNCGSSLAAGASCTVNVTFAPTAAGTQSDTLSLAGSSGGAIATVSGTGLWLRMAPSSLTFPLQLVGTTSVAQAITLTNVSSTSQNISISLSGGLLGGQQFVQTNNCGASLAAGASCTVNVTFTPTVAGALRASLNAGDLFGQPGGNLFGTGTYVSLIPSTLSFAAQDVGTISPAQTVTVTNSSSNSITLNAITTSGDFAQSSNCPSSSTPLAAGASCTITMTFNPTAGGTRSGMLTLADSDLGSPQTVSLSGFGNGLSATPASLSFPPQLIGTTSAPQAVTLTNTSGTTLAVALNLYQSSFAQTNNCGSSLAAGATCTVNITFTPAALGSQNGTLVNGPGFGTPIVAITGIGTWLGVSPSSLSFPLQLVGTTSAPQVLTLTNTASSSQNFMLFLSGASFAQSNNCSSPLAAGASCIVSVKFTPVAAGAQNGLLDFGTLVGNPTANLFGTGTVVGVAPTSLSFAAQMIGTTSPAQSITVINNGSSSVTFNGIAVTGDYSQSGNCPPNGGVLPANTSCMISVTFNPTASGARTGTLTISDSDLASPQTVTLSGTGIAPVAQLSPATLTFSGEPIGASSAPQSITVTNTGDNGSSLQISGATVTGDFSQSNNCGAPLSVGSSCTITVIFTATAPGTRSGVLSVSDNTSNSPQTVSLTGTGTSQISPRAAVLTPGQTQQFTTPLTGPTWAVNGITGGSSAVGTITTGGLYTAPPTVGTYSVTATSGAQQGGATVYVSGFAGVYTYHNDIARTGQNIGETALAPGNVNAGQFGKRFSLSVDGNVYAQPLYVRGVSISGKGTHNVVFVSTEHDTVYAFDADSNSGTNANPLWKVSLIPAGGSSVSTTDVSCSNISPQMGITGTPVIDPASQTLYVISKTKESGKFFQRLHALDITTGAEKFGGPKVIQASVAGTGDGSSGGTVSFDPLRESNRAGLLLQNGQVYIAWASHCDHSPYHGWVMAYNAQTLARVAVFNTSPNTGLTGIWMGGAGLAGDGSNIFFATGNGPFDVNAGGTSYGDSILRLSPPSGGTFQVGSYFTPFDQNTLNGGDTDLGSAGVLLLPTQTGSHPHLLTQAGKEGRLYLVDRDAMGGYCSSACNNTDPQIVQEIPGAVTGIWGMPAFWNNNLYFGGIGSTIQAFSFNALGNGLISGPTSHSSVASTGFGPTPSVSANGASNGIVWVNEWSANGKAILRALDATDLSKELYNSTQNVGTLSGYIRFTTPTIANGKVFVGTQNTVDVYGFLP